MDIIDAALALKAVPRRGWVDAGVERPESVAAHSYGTAVLSMFMADADGLDGGRAVRMALLHDLAESITGDIVPGSVPPERKREAERRAMDCILDRLPEPLRGEYRRIWLEYVRQESPEAALVRDADRLDMALQAKTYAGGAETGAFRPFVESAKRGISGRRAGDIMRGAGL